MASSGINSVVEEEPRVQIAKAVAERLLYREGLHARSHFPVEGGDALGGKGRYCNSRSHCPAYEIRDA